MSHTETFQWIPIEQLERGTFQPRRVFDAEKLTELAISIAAEGLIEPLIVRSLHHHPMPRYELIAGERRWRAAMQAKLQEIPCIIRDYNDEQAAAVSLIENIQRENLNLIEEAEGYQRLIETFHFSQQAIADKVGKSRSHIANLLRLLTLCPEVLEKIAANILSLGHARMLVGLEIPLQRSLAHQIVHEQWSVRELEAFIRRTQKNLASQPTIDPDRHLLQNELSRHLNAPVEITSDEKNGGWLKIKFYDHETLQGLLERFTTIDT